MSTPTTSAADSAANPFALLNAAAGTSKTDKGDTTASADRFLKMLVTQMQNQDPLNPLDNAQVTSQMAQINAVTGLEKVNTSIQSLAGQMLKLQALQGAALVGHDVALAGDAVSFANGVGRGMVELDAAAGAVRVDIVNASGQAVGRVDLGPSDAGRHVFEWPPGRLDPSAGYTFRVTATAGAAAVGARTLALERVQSVSTGNDTLTLGLAGGASVAIGDVVAFR